MHVFFAVSTDGYSVPADGFGNEQVTVVVSAGKRHVLQMTRTQKAERLFRLTGFGVYLDSVLLGEATPTKQPLLNADVLGQDSILAVPFNGKIHWYWGDTNRMAYPLGNFESTGATSCLPSPDASAASAAECMSPDDGIDLTYYTAPDSTVRPNPNLPSRLASKH